MAELRVKGEYVGPGEQKTAEKLRDELPADWVIFANRKLAGSTRDDVDLIVVGNSVVFALEEKAWGPRVVVGDNHWYVGDSVRPNPLNRVGQISRKIAGLLRDHARGYQDLRGKRVIPAVVLSHDRLSLHAGPNHDLTENIIPLSQARDYLLEIDESWKGPTLGQVRTRVLAYLDDLPDRSLRRRIGDYVIEGQLEVAGLEEAYAAQSSDGQQVVLKCYPVARLEEYGDPTDFLRRESLALNKLADIGRTWRAFPPFHSEEHGLFVVPVLPPTTGRTLEAFTRKPGTERTAGQLDADVARDVVLDAFTALSDVHEYGLVHRALHPRRIWLGRRMRVMFSDFHLARISGEGTIRLWAPDFDISEAYRAPECAADVGLATPQSDVYSLTLCLASWLLGKEPGDMSLERIQAELLDAFPWTSPLVGALGPAQQRRRAAEIVEALTEQDSLAPAPAPDPVFQADSIIAGRYQLIRELGRGGFATSWLVHDAQVEQTKVLKQFHHGVPQELRAEYRAADNLHHDRCGRVYDVQVDSDPPYLVSEYVEGESLATKGVDRDVEEIRAIAEGVLEALAYIHSKDLVHGDVTPANVIVATDGSGFAKLIDFGLAVKNGERPLGLNPKFSPPEVLRGLPATSATDLFGFAATVAYAMLGRPATRVEGQDIVLEPPTEAELKVWGSDGSALLRAVMQGVKSSPAERPKSASEFAALIRSARPPDLPALPSSRAELEPRINENVTAIRRLYRGSSAGNAGNRGLDDEFAVATYVPTLLDAELLPRIIAGDFELVLLSGNPGDGKTSLLVQLGEALRQAGAVEEASDEAGWRLRLDDHVFVSVFDASESHGELSADELVRQALAPVVSGRSATALIAVNDGRLLQFFTDHEDDYEDLWFDVRDQLAGLDMPDSKVVLVDLKRRSLATIGGTSGLANKALDALTDEALWMECDQCSAQSACPILANRFVLASGGAEAFGELMLISHLRRRRRATFRDVRSAAAWLLTGDRSCEDIHATLEDERDPRLLDDALVRDLAFSSRSNDYLINEWSQLDPSVIAAPGADRLRRTLHAPQLAALDSASAVTRALYFREIAPDELDASAVRAYRYLDEFTTMLKGDDPDATRDRLLLGISRLVGAFGYLDSGLAMSSGMSEAAWAVLHTVPVAQFAVAPPTASQRYVETIPDQLRLRHEGGSELLLTLDTAEIILRAADGEIIDDPPSDAIRQEIDSFVSQLARQPSRTARIVDTSGSVAVATVHGPAIALEQP